MEKASKFWSYLCDELNYRFFTGVACAGFKSIFDAMDSKVMHYVPAINERVALGIATGVSLAGHKSGLLIDANNYSYLKEELKFNDIHKIPVLIIASSSDFIDNLNENYFVNAVDKAEDYIIKHSKPRLLVLRGGIFK